MRTSPFLVIREPRRDKREHYNLVFMVVDAANKTHALSVAAEASALFRTNESPDTEATYKKPEVVPFTTNTLYRR